MKLTLAKKTAVIVDVACFLLIFLWTYASVSKLTNITILKHDMLNQPIPHWLAIKLMWIIPVTELVLVALLMPSRLRFWGLLGSTLLMLVFTIYTLLILLKKMAYVPCGCGGVIRFLTWPQHLVFNLFFLTVALAGVLFYRKSNI